MPSPRDILWREELLLRQHDTNALIALAPLTRRYAPWTAGAMRPSGVEAIVNEIVVGGRACVVEFGAGVSTLFAARALEEQGGRLWTVENDDAWVRSTRALIDEEGLAGVATVVYAPDEPSERALDGCEWYAEAALDAALPDSGIDLVVVDGPPAHEDDLARARYPAVPYVRDRLAADWTIVLDDIDREGEQDVVRRWESELEVTFARRPIDGGIAIAHSPR